VNCSADNTLEEHFEAAQASCSVKASGYNLASFTSQAEIDEMKRVMTHDGGEYWTGLKYTKSTDSWNFTDGTDAKFALSLPFLTRADHNAVTQCMLINSYGTLRATHCNGIWKYICCRADQNYSTTVPPTSSG
jgi:hypothetical protein